MRRSDVSPKPTFSNKQYERLFNFVMSTKPLQVKLPVELVRKQQNRGYDERRYETFFGENEGEVAINPVVHPEVTSPPPNEFETDWDSNEVRQQLSKKDNRRNNLSLKKRLFGHIGASSLRLTAAKGAGTSVPPTRSPTSVSPICTSTPALLGSLLQHSNLELQSKLNVSFAVGEAETATSLRAQQKMLRQLRPTRASTVLAKGYTPPPESANSESSETLPRVDDHCVGGVQIMQVHSGFLLSKRHKHNQFLEHSMENVDRKEHERSSKFWKKYAGFDLSRNTLKFKVTPSDVLHDVEKLLIRDASQTRKEEARARRMAHYNIVVAHCQENGLRNEKIDKMLAIAYELQKTETNPRQFFQRILPVLDDADCLFDENISAAIHIGDLMGVKREEVIEAIRELARCFIDDHEEVLNDIFAKTEKAKAGGLLSSVREISVKPKPAVESYNVSQTKLSPLSSKSPVKQPRASLPPVSPAPAIDGVGASL